MELTFYLGEKDQRKVDDKQLIESTLTSGDKCY